MQRVGRHAHLSNPPPYALLRPRSFSRPTNEQRCSPQRAERRRRTAGAGRRSQLTRWHCERIAKLSGSREGAARNLQSALQRLLGWLNDSATPSISRLVVPYRIVAAAAAAVARAAVCTDLNVCEVFERAEEELPRRSRNGDGSRRAIDCPHAWPVAAIARRNSWRLEHPPTFAERTIVGAPHFLSRKRLNLTLASRALPDASSTLKRRLQLCHLPAFQASVAGGAATAAAAAFSQEPAAGGA